MPDPGGVVDRLVAEGVGRANLDVGRWQAGEVLGLGRYRNSLAHRGLLEPEHVYEVRLDLSVTSNEFQPGHRIRLEISSSNFPRYDPNTNTGGDISEENAEQALVATNRILHGAEHLSRLILPIIRR